MPDHEACSCVGALVGSDRWDATPDFIGTEAGTIVISGPKRAFDASADMFGALGGNVQHIGEEPGRTNALDSALLALLWGALFGTLHAIAVSQAEGIDLDELARQWSATVPVVDGLVSDLIKRINASRFASDDETLSTIFPHHTSLQHLLALMEARRIDRALVDGYTPSSNERLLLATSTVISRRSRNSWESLQASRMPLTSHRSAGSREDAHRRRELPLPV